MKQEEFREVLDRYLHDDCSDEERAFVENWFENVQSQDVLMGLEKDDLIKEKIWSSITNKSNISNFKRNGFSYWKAGKIAASFVLLVTSLFVLLKYSKSNFVTTFTSEAQASAKMITITNSGKSIQLVRLNDSSVIQIYPGSKISYPERFGENREVHLTGEAFFNIAKDPNHPFLVYANEVTTRVLGTSFLVKAYDEQKEIVVTVKSGRVSVSSKPMEKSTHGAESHIILTPNQQAVYNRDEGKVQRQLVEMPEIIKQPLPRELLYTNAAVISVFDALGKMYGVDIQYDAVALRNCTITSDLSDEGLYDQIELICQALDAQYEIDETTIRIKAKGCE